MRNLCPTLLAGAVALTFTLGCNQPDDDDLVGGPAPGDTTGADCQPLETRAANAPEQTPAFEAQTRACGVETSTAVNVVVVATGLEHPWAVEPMPDGNLLVTERPGRMRVVSAAGALGAPLQGLPEVDAGGQGGLLDVALSPDFADSRLIFWSYSEPREGGNATSVARGVLSQDNTSLSDVRVILRTLPVYDGDKHFGSRLAFGPDGNLFVTMGERSDAPMRRYAQMMDSHLGKVLRIAPDGSIPDGNPFMNEGDTLPEIWSLGHRNVQAAAFDESGELWVIEHGTQGGDELNKIKEGANYGWAEVAYGEEYGGGSLNMVTQREGTEQPRYYWDPVIAPSGAQFYTGNAFPSWRGNLLVGSLKDMKLVRLVLDGDEVHSVEHLLGDRGKRIRDVRQAGDGTLFIVTDEAAGELWQVTP